MSTRKRRSPTNAPATDGGSVPKDAVDHDTTGSYAEVNSLLFDPNRILLRRVFFLDPDKTKYISLGLYPARNYQPLVEIGSTNVRPILLTDQHVKTLANTFRLRLTLCGGMNSSMWGTVNSLCTLPHPIRQQYWLWAKSRIEMHYSSNYQNYGV